MTLGLLLDTHVALWWSTGELDPSADVTAAIAEPANTIWLSVASVWELAIKVRTGKLLLDVTGFVDKIADAGVTLLGIGADDAIAAGLLDWDHRDPFDRMLAAQVKRLGCRLATRDPVLLEFLGETAMRV